METVNDIHAQKLSEDNSVSKTLCVLLVDDNPDAGAMRGFKLETVGNEEVVVVEGCQRVEK